MKKLALFIVLFLISLQTDNHTLKMPKKLFISKNNGTYKTTEIWFNLSKEKRAYILNNYETIKTIRR